jgi:hypothetical protein
MSVAILTIGETMSKKKELTSEEVIEKKIWNKIQSFLAFIVLITGFGLWQVYVKTQDLTSKIVADRISKQFEEPRIKQSLTEVANSKGEEILSKQVRPEIELLKSEIKNELDSVRRLSEELKTKYLTEYNTFKQEVVKLEERNTLTRLADKAIAYKDRKALEDLDNITKNSPNNELKMAASSEISRIKTDFATMTSIKGFQVVKKGRLGSVSKDNELSTNDLIVKLKKDPIWENRARSAEILATRKEKVVPGILLEVMKDEQNLEVAKTALMAFERITGYDSPDVFGFGYANEWWANNKLEVEKKLQ